MPQEVQQTAPAAPVHSSPQIGDGLLLVLFLIGCAASLFKAWIQRMDFRQRETWGRIGIGGILSMAAATTPLVFPSASPTVQCGVAAALAIVGDAFAVNWLKKKLGVDDGKA